MRDWRRDGAARQRVGERGVELGGAVAVEQHAKATDVGRERLAPSCQGVEKRFGLGTDAPQTVATAMHVRAPLLFGEAAKCAAFSTMAARS